MKAEEIRSEYTKTYDQGILNHGVRAWFYLQKGLNLINEFKYLVAGILALYYTLQFDSYWILIGIFVVSIPVLTFIGWFHTHKMSKAMEWTAMVFSSYFARYNVDLNEKTADHTEKNTKLLEAILHELQNKGKI
jgi:hypothetical protein